MPAFRGLLSLWRRTTVSGGTGGGGAPTVPSLLPQPIRHDRRVHTIQLRQLDWPTLVGTAHATVEQPAVVVEPRMATGGLVATVRSTTRPVSVSGRSTHRSGVGSSTTGTREHTDWSRARLEEEDELVCAALMILMRSDER